MLDTFYPELLTTCSGDEEAGAVDGRSAAASLLQDPNVMAALQVSQDMDTFLVQDSYPGFSPG